MRHSQCILEVDLSKICANYKILSNIANNTEVASVVKANSYGLGADKISKALEKEGCANFRGDSFHHLPQIDSLVMHINHFVTPSGQVLANKIRTDRQFAMAAVNHDG